MMGNRARKFLGVDWGKKRIGLALGEEEVGIASPWKVVSGLDEVLQAVEEEGIDVLVLGLPLQIHDQEAELNSCFQEFLDSLKKTSPVQIITWDERLSTKEATSLNKKVAHRIRAEEDAVSAMLILQKYFDSYL